LIIPDAVCTVLCSWWWAEKPPETCRGIYRNKWTDKTLHLVGSTLETNIHTRHKLHVYVHVCIFVCSPKPPGDSGEYGQW
jgi:hypothetical protein